MALTIAGVLRDSGGSPVTGGSSKTMVLYKDGTLVESVETSTIDGTYAFASFAASAGDSVMVVVEGETEKGSISSVTDGTTNLTSFDVRDDRIRIRNDNGGSTTIADMADRDKDDDGTNLFFTANTGAPDLLTLDAGRNLEVVSGNTFKPTGDCDIGSDTVGGTSVFIAGTWEETSGDDLNMKRALLDATGGSFTAGSGTVTFSGNAIITWVGNSITIASLTIDTTAGLSMSGTMTVSGTLTLTDGNFNGSGTLNWTGATCTMAAAFGFNGTSNNGVINITGTGAQAVSSSGGIFPGVNFNKASGTVTFTGDAGDSDRFIIIKPFTLTSATATVDFTTNNVFLKLIAPAGSGSINTFSVTPGITLFKLEVDSDANTTIAGIATINDDMVWTDGNLKLVTDEDTDRFDVHGDITAAVGAGASVLDNRATIRLVGTGAQLITNNGMWCALQINKPSGTATFDGDGANEWAISGQFEHTTGAVDWTTNTVRIVVAKPNGSGTFRDFDPNGTALYALELDAIADTIMISAFTVANNLFITDGNWTQGASGNVQVSGNIIVAATGGENGSGHDALITMVGSVATTITMAAGGFVPLLTIDKTNATDTVTVSGGSLDTSKNLTMEKGHLILDGVGMDLGADRVIKGSGASTIEFIGTGDVIADWGSNVTTPTADAVLVNKTSGKVTFSEDMTCDDFQKTAGQTVELEAGAIYNVNAGGVYKSLGTEASPVTFETTIAATQATFTLGAGVVQDVHRTEATDIDSSGGDEVDNVAGNSSNSPGWDDGPVLVPTLAGAI